MPSQIKVDQITDSSGTTAPEFPNGINASNMPGRNKIINGDFRINQRAYVSGTNTTAANQYTLDRWRVVVSGQNLAFAASGNGNIVTAPAGGIEQVIEGSNIEGGTYVLNWVGVAVATVNGTARAKGEAFTLTANTNATVKFSGGTVSLVQLEAGSIVTPFEYRDYGEELALCQRYYQIGYARISAYASSGSNLSTSTTSRAIMRATPTLSASWSTNNITGIPTINYYNHCIVIDGVSSSTGYARIIATPWIADAEL